jgi:hypothetical protein
MGPRTDRTAVVSPELKVKILRGIKIGSIEN